jgi:hypothetical protein
MELEGLLPYPPNVRNPESDQSIASHSTHLRCGLVVRVPGCRTEMYYVFCAVQTEFIYVM